MCKRIPPDGLEEPLPFFTLYNYDQTFTKYKQVYVDCCLVPLITTLHSQGIRTLGSCCGHDKSCGGIVIDIHSVATTIQLGYRVNVQYMWGVIGHNNYDDFPIYKIERFNDSCRGCPNLDHNCSCSCHDEVLEDEI